VLILDNQKCDGMHARETYAILFGECGIVKIKKWVYILMMLWCMMFAGVVCAIEDALLPKILELALRMPTFARREALGSDVGGGDRSGIRLNVAEFL
jgi:hypothetical protein